MSFWNVVLASLIGAPAAAGLVMMMAIFGAASLANANRDIAAGAVAVIGVAACWALAAVFGAFGVMPAWRAWHGGAENFAGGSASFIHWLAGTGIVGGLWWAQWCVQLRIRDDMAAGRKATPALWWLVASVNLACFGLLAGWLLWPLAAWPFRGHFEWPDARTGWVHTAEVVAVFAGVMLGELGVRKLRAR